MAQSGIFHPVLVLVGWTLLVLLVIPYRRFKAAFAGQVTAKDFRFGESANVPPDVSIPNRNYMNLLEAPLLFYVICFTLFQLQHVDSLVVALAWGYVALRVVHSIIHLTYNRVEHRLVAFALSNAVLAAIWLKAVAGVFGEG